MLRITMDMPESITSVHDALDPDPDTLLAVVRVCTCRLCCSYEWLENRSCCSTIGGQRGLIYLQLNNIIEMYGERCCSR
jgi:hypothetical protein